MFQLGFKGKSRATITGLRNGIKIFLSVSFTIINNILRNIDTLVCCNLSWIILISLFSQVVG